MECYEFRKENEYNEKNDQNLLIVQDPKIHMVKKQIKKTTIHG